MIPPQKLKKLLPKQVPTLALLHIKQVSGQDRYQFIKMHASSLPNSDGSSLKKKVTNYYYIDIHSVVQHGSCSSLNSVVFLAANSISSNELFLMVSIIFYFLSLIHPFKIFRSAHMKVMNRHIIMSIFVRSKPKKIFNRAILLQYYLTHAIKSYNYYPTSECARQFISETGPNSIKCKSGSMYSLLPKVFECSEGN